MRLVLVAAVALTAALSPARAEAPARWWSFDVPAGWTDTTERHAGEVAQMREQMGRVLRGFYAYASPDGTIEVMLYETRETPSAGSAGTARAVVASYEQGARDSLKTAPEIRYAQREDGPTLVTDHVVQRPDGATARLRRIAGVDRDGRLAGITVMCAGLDSVCTPLMDGLRADPAAFQPLDTKLGGGSSSSFDSGYRLGRAIGVAGVLAIVIGLVMRKKRRDQQRANPGV